MTEEKSAKGSSTSGGKKWKKEVSAGGVVYKKDNEKLLILLIMPMGQNFGPPEGYWTFPKGKINEGENKEEAARREVKEETGVDAKIVADLSYVKFFRSYDNTLKFVHFFLMQYVAGDLSKHDREVFEVKWVALAQVEPLLRWPNDKETFERAKTNLIKHV